ncbi:hypothetical protein BDE02_10G056700 [Populus trichocarpa]|nr:hypothetical protein BDE02_10G056700 [Populus trichocarpa]
MGSLYFVNPSRHPCFFIFILTQPPSSSSSLNLSHSPPSPPNVFISHLSQLFFKALSTTPLLPQSRSGERTIHISHLSIFLFFSLSIAD